MSDDWARLTERSNEFYSHLGIAITMWAGVEERLFEICAAILKSEPRHVAIIYYRTPSLEARRSLTNDLVVSLFPDRESGQHATEEEKKWDAINKDIRTQLVTRNHLAHSPASLIVAPEPAVFPRANLDLWFASHMSDTERLRERKTRDHMKIEDLKVHLAAVVVINNDLLSFGQNELTRLLNGSG
jgi:hypothetical protein